MPDGARGRIVSADEVLADDAALLRRLHAGLQRQGVPSPAAATYLAGWFPGGVARAVGVALAVGGTGLLVERDQVRWHLHPDGWPERVELGHAHGEVVGSSMPPVVARTVSALVTAVTPLVDACRGLAKVGRAGLWNEVGDALGTALAYELDRTVTPAMTAVLDAAVHTPRAPWKAKPALRFASASFGAVHVVQKGGCCLAYTEDRADADYCLTCSLRDPADCDARQVAYLELLRHARQTPHQSVGR